MTATEANPESQENTSPTQDNPSETELQETKAHDEQYLNSEPVATKNPDEHKIDVNETIVSKPRPKTGNYTEGLKTSVPIQLEWKNIDYVVSVRPSCFKRPIKKKILDSLSGYVAPYVNLFFTNSFF
jgi:hypothetical protein